MVLVFACQYMEEGKLKETDSKEPQKQKPKEDFDQTIHMGWFADDIYYYCQKVRDGNPNKKK